MKNIEVLDSRLTITLERLFGNDATFRSVTTDLGHACLWLDPDTSSCFANVTEVLIYQ